MYEVHRFRLGLASKEPKTVLCVMDLVDGMGFEESLRLPNQQVTEITLSAWC